MKEFTLPENSQTYVNTVKDRCQDLIQYKIWSGIKSLDLKRWFNNFNGDLEQYFAACILDALIYRSEDQLVALANELFTKKLYSSLESVGFQFEHYKSLIDLLKSSPTNQLRLVSVSTKNERPVKSSNMILRAYKRKLGLNENWFIHPNEVKIEKESNGVNTFVFIDDFLGTGKQFQSMYKSYGFQLLLKKSNVLYAPLVAHSRGVGFLTDQNSNLVITASEYLNDNNDVFNNAFKDGINTPESAKSFYDELLTNNNFSDLLDENKYGFGNLGLAYTFAHSSPDNCLHIIWDNQNGGWHPLIAK